MEGETTRVMGQRLLDLGNGLEIWSAPITALKEQDENARAMAKETMDRLTMTMARDKRMESLPLCALTERGIEIISGHHRKRAAAAAGLKEIHVIVDTTGLTRDQIAAKQLAHNAIAGQDDAQLVARIYASIRNAEARLESFVRAEDLELPKTKIDDLALAFEAKTVGITFMPRQTAKFEQAIEALMKQFDVLYVAELEQFKPFRELINRMAREYDIRNLATMLTKMSEIVLEYLGVEEQKFEEVVPIRDLFGISTVPKETAERIQEVIDVLKKDGQIVQSNRWLALEYMAQSFPFVRKQ